jgi:beta-glucosidase
LQDEGGWSARATADAFVHYAHIVTERLGDRVKHWMTHNEPWCIATLGYEQGEHAPGHKDAAESLRVAHHLLLSHGWATRAIRTNCDNAQVGIVLNLLHISPATESADDRDAVRQLDGIFNRWYLDPLYNAKYPLDAIDDRHRWGHLAEAALPFVEPGDMRAIAEPLDFLGVNYYSRAVVKSGKDGKAEAVQVAPKADLTDMGWEVHPEGLYNLLLRLKREYHPPRIYITESGAAYSDAPDAQGRVRDERRIEFLRRHLLEALRAQRDGVPLAGYFVWSLLDNFEWGHGYEKRFGINWVDYETLERLPKDSAHWYRATIAAHAVEDQPTLATRRVS